METTHGNEAREMFLPVKTYSSNRQLGEAEEYPSETQLKEKYSNI